MEYLFNLIFFLLLVLYGLSEFLPLFFLGRKKRERRNDYPPISIVIPVKNEEKVIEQTINSWLDIDYPSSKEILICDQNSTDNTQKIINEKFINKTEVKHLLIESPNKLNTLLAGIREAKYDYLVISDADRFPGKDSIKNLMPFITGDVGAVFGMPHVVGNNKPFQKITTIEYLSSMIDMLFYSNVDSVPYLFLHSAIIKKSLLVNLEPQNLIADDLYFALHIRKHGFKGIFTPEVDAGEEHVYDFPDLLKRRLRTSQGTIEIAKSNYLGTAFNPAYNAFGLFLMPFRQLTMTVANLSTLLFFFLLLIRAIMQTISSAFVLKVTLTIYFLVLVSQLLRFNASLKIFPKSAQKVPMWAVLAYPVYFLLVRKLLSGYTFFTVLLGKKYAWKKVTSDRKE